MATGAGRSDGAQIFRRRLAPPSIRHNLERDLLSLAETAHPGAFDRADVHENILAAVIRLNETEALLLIEPLHGSLRHETLPSNTSLGGRAQVIDRELEEDHRSGAERAAAKSFGRNSNSRNMVHISAFLKRRTERSVVNKSNSVVHCFFEQGDSWCG
jgi:hypothetical protein